MNLANTLTELGNRLGIGAIELDANGGCLLAFDNDLVVDIEQASEASGFYLTATVGPAPQEERETVFAELLDANLQGRGTGRACLALDADLDEIVLSRYIERDDIEIETLEQELELFLNTLEHWKQRHEAGEIGNIRGTGAAPSMMPSNNNIIRG